MIPVTPQVANLVLPLQDYNLYASDSALREAVAQHQAGWAEDELLAWGHRLGQKTVQEQAELANRYTPQLRTHDRTGRRRDEVEFHPAWHALLGMAVNQAVHVAPWLTPRPGAQVARAAAYYLLAQVENGIQCPLTMTYAAIPVLRRFAEQLPSLKQDWLPRLFSCRYDARFIPITKKDGALIGMGMTEKQGGSDVRANTTHATPVAGSGPGREYRLEGHKWFFSAPMCDAFLVLAQTSGGLSCFFLPRFTEDGQANAIHIQRLKDKLGNRSNASSEVEFHQAQAWLLGEEGRGISTILEMGTLTRLDCAIGTAGLMRQAVVQALHHATHRQVFGKALIAQPLMQNVLADLALEAEAAMQITLRLARAFDSPDEPGESALRRLLTPAVKFWVCKRGPLVAAEAMEVLGGNGYVEEYSLSRIYREMPLNSIWEGSGNIMCLDVLRALRQSPESRTVLFSELDQARGGNVRLDRMIRDLHHTLDSGDSGENLAEKNARQLTEQLVLALQAALMIRYTPEAVAQAFCAARLTERWSGVFGVLSHAIDCQTIIERAWRHIYS